jgi:RNA polymerase sigma factor (sigma-70 family)
MDAMDSSTAFTLDDETIRAARAHDRRALRRIFDVLAPAMLGYGRGQGVEDPDALANETLYRALRDIGRFTGDAAGFRSWVFTIAHNLIIDDRRRRSRRPETVDLERARSRPDGTFVAEAALDRVEVAETMRWIHELPDNQRTVLLLRLLGDLSIAEVAGVVGKSQGAVKALHRRGLVALRRKISTAGVSRDDPKAFTTVP